MIGLLLAGLQIAAAAPPATPPPLPLPYVPADQLAAGVVVASAMATRVEVTGQTPLATTTAPALPAGLDGMPFAPAGLDDCDEMSWYRQQAGLPARFDSLGWRESNCRQEVGVHTWCCWGWWQLYPALHLDDHRMAPRYAACGVDHRTDYDGPEPIEKQRQACAAKALYDVEGFTPWNQ